jgi:hypothetical protein
VKLERETERLWGGQAEAASVNPKGSMQRRNSRNLRKSQEPSEMLIPTPYVTSFFHPCPSQKFELTNFYSHLVNSLPGLRADDEKNQGRDGIVSVVLIFALFHSR